MPVEAISADDHNGEREQDHVDAHGAQPENRQVAGDLLGKEVPACVGNSGHQDQEKYHCAHSGNILILHVFVVKYLLANKKVDNLARGGGRLALRNHKFRGYMP